MGKEGVGVVWGGVNGLCTSDARYWHTDTAAACNRREILIDINWGASYINRT